MRTITLLLSAGAILSSVVSGFGSTLAERFGGLVDPPSRVIKWVETDAIRLTSVLAESDFYDLAPLASKLGSVEVVALGEDTHGSKQVFQMKHRLVEYLVSELGFSIFAIEANMPEARRLTDYVLGGEGDPATLLRGMYFWTWRTEEVLAMVEWMRRFNMDPVHRAEGRQIEFTGFDMQFHKVPLGIVRDFLEKHAPESLRQFYRVSTAIEALDGRSPDLAQLNVTQEAWRECIRVVDKVGGAEVSVGENDEYAWARQNAQLIAQWLQGRSEVSGRDRAMAENVMWLRKRKPHAKIVLWAHNGHVSKRPLSMGGYLAAELGDRFAVFGFSSGAGTYRARAQKDRALGAFILEEPEIGSVEAVFAKSGVERFVLDLRRARDPASEGFWFNEPHGHRAVGAMEMRRQFRSHTIAQNYDFIVWLSSVEASAVLPEK